MKQVIYGAPGTGKTTYLIKLIEKELSKRDFDDVAYMTFTKKAAEDAKRRVSNEIGISERDLKYFGTIHSMCYMLIKNYEMKVITMKDFSKFCNENEYSVGSFSFSQEDLVNDVTNMNDNGNIMLDMYEKARLLYPNNTDKYKIYLDKYKFSYNEFIDYNELQSFIDNWEIYKDSNGLVDFGDMLERTIRRDLKLPCDVQFYDEHQDISPLINEVYNHFSGSAKKVYVAGDPFQSVYGFIGTSPSFFLKEKFDEELILPNSFRLPRKIWDYAKDFIIKNDKCYYDISNVKSTADDGSISNYNFFDVSMISSGSTYILSRVWRLLLEFRSELINNGIPFVMGKGNIWNSKLIGINNALYDYDNSDTIHYKDLKQLIRSCSSTILEKGVEDRFSKNRNINMKFKIDDLKELFKSSFTSFELFNKLKLSYMQSEALSCRLGKLSKIDNIDLYLGTIHSVKGLEADNVILTNEITNIVENNINEKGIKEEARIFFVGMTRAMKSLILLDEPFGRISFPFT